MTKKEIVLWLVLADFVALTAYTIFTESYLAFIPFAAEMATGSFWGLQLLVDFVLAVAIGLGFVFFDARRRNLTAWPFVVLTLTLGSIGLLGYLVYRERASAPAAEVNQPEPAHA